MPSLSVAVVPYSGPNFEEKVSAAANQSDVQRIDQVRYLTTYLSNAKIGARTMVIEAPYTDRHYVEEFAGYYSTCLILPLPTTCRIHLFATAFTEGNFLEQLKRAAAGHYDEVQRELQDAYRGFVVVRPLASCPIGRTVLRPFSSAEGRRHYSATNHHVHLCGIHLRLRGIPFQQARTSRRCMRHNRSLVRPCGGHVTDIARDQPKYANVIGFFAFSEDVVEACKDLAVQHAPHAVVC